MDVLRSFVNFDIAPPMGQRPSQVGEDSLNILSQLRETTPNLQSEAQNVSSFSQRLSQVKETISNLINSPGTSRRISQAKDSLSSMMNSPETSRRISEVKDSINSIINNPEASQKLSQVKETINNLVSSPQKITEARDVIPVSPRRSKDTSSSTDHIVKGKIGTYQLEQELGHGSFGVTYQAIDIKTGMKVAIKTINIAKSKEKGVEMDEIQDEVEVSKYLSSYPECNEHMACYIEDFKGVFEGNPSYFVVSELIDGQNVRSYLKIKGQLYPDELWDAMSQLIKGLEYIHMSGYAHRDIKTDNIMRTYDGQYKYIDFGLACLAMCRDAVQCAPEKDIPCKGRVGTPFYDPPEFFLPENNPDSLYHLSDQEYREEALAHDIWSLGIVFFEMANGTVPFRLENADTREDIARRIVTYPANSRYSLSSDEDENEVINEIIEDMLIKDWRTRPPVDKLAPAILTTHDYIHQDRTYSDEETTELIEEKDIPDHVSEDEVSVDEVSEDEIPDFEEVSDEEISWIDSEDMSDVELFDEEIPDFEPAEKTMNSVYGSTGPSDTKGSVSMVECHSTNGGELKCRRSQLYIP